MKTMTVISEPIYMQSVRTWRDRASIPNRVGFPLVVLTFGGLQVRTHVVKRRGLHVLASIAISRVAGWRDVEPDDPPEIN